MRKYCDEAKECCVTLVGRISLWKKGDKDFLHTKKKRQGPLSWKKRRGNDFFDKKEGARTFLDKKEGTRTFLDIFLGDQHDDSLNGREYMRKYSDEAKECCVTLVGRISLWKKGDKDFLHTKKKRQGPLSWKKRRGNDFFDKKEGARTFLDKKEGTRTFLDIFLGDQHVLAEVVLSDSLL